MADSVSINISLWSSGVLHCVEASGHAGNVGSGSNIPCAAISVLLRTFCEAVSSYEGLVSKGSAPKPGLMSFEIVSYPEGYLERLLGITDFLIVGLKSVACEYPEMINIKFESIRRN